MRSDTSDDSLETIANRLSLLAIQQCQEFGRSQGEVYDLVIDEVERQLLREALEHNNGVKTRTADFLGINRNTLDKKIKELGIQAN